MDYSFVVPVFNEQNSLKQLYSEIIDVCNSNNWIHYEILFIDDGSTDRSFEVIKGLGKNAFGIQLRKNFGKATALKHGFTLAKGNIVFTLDSDLQDLPSEFPNFIKKINEGYDLVSGWKKKRNDPLSKTLPSKVFNWLTCKASGLKLHDFNCGLKAYRKEVCENIELYGELHRFIPFLAYEQGYRIAEIPVSHRPRKHGISKYGWERFARGSLDLITVVATTKYLRRPGHFFGGSGLLTGGVGGIILTYLTIMKLFFSQPISARPLFFLGILCILIAAQFISLGVLAELILKTSQPSELKNQIKERTY